MLPISNILRGDEGGSYDTHFQLYGLIPTNWVRRAAGGKSLTLLPIGFLQIEIGAK